MRYWLHVAVSAHNKFSTSHFQFIPSKKVRAAFGRGGIVDFRIFVRLIDERNRENDIYIFHIFETSMCAKSQDER